MQFPESWLREFCSPSIDTQALAEMLTMAGLEVEGLRPAGAPFERVVVAEILEVCAHPNADRLQICTVNAGGHSGQAHLQVVCGAPNARPGLRAPLALVGAVLPGAEPDKALHIAQGSIRGVESTGMLCSARELKLSEDHGGLLELPADAPIGQDLRHYLKLDDTLFTLKLTPNLAHCLSVYGVAREVSALSGAPLSVPVFQAAPVSHSAVLPVRIEAPELCGRFSGRIVRNVNIQAKTPPWMVERLQRCGQRPVSALVDISNYVMFEYGQPSHIFDLDKIHEHLVVRWAKPGESLELLNGATVAVDAQVGVIADAQQVESLAGIMGGQSTAVSDDTRNVYVEAAFWWPEAVAGRSRRYAFTTEAGHRFERGVDPALTVEHIEHITKLIIDICGGQAGPMDDQQLRLPERAEVTLRVERASKVIGVPINPAQCAAVFDRLGLPHRFEGGRFVVKPPTWRFDLKLEEDLIEEVARILGFDSLPMLPPIATLLPRVRPERRRSASQLRHALASLDYQETINFSFVEDRWEHELAGNADPVKVLNPIAAHMAVMRSSLIASLISVLQRNLARRAGRVRIFELARVALRDPSAVASIDSVAGISQPRLVSGLAYGALDTTQWGSRERAVDYFDVKGDIESLLWPVKATFEAATHAALHPGRSARVLVDGQAIGFVGELHPRWRQRYELPQAPVVFELKLDAVLDRAFPDFRSMGKHQASWRDLAMVVPETVKHDQMIEALTQDPEGLIQSVTLFDVYRPSAASSDMAGNECGMAFRVELVAPDSTLTDSLIDAVIQRAVERTRERCGARLRA